MRRVRLIGFASLSCSLLALTACHPRFRRETLGTGTAVLAAPGGGGDGPSAAPGGGGVTVAAPGTHEIRWAIQVPRAMRVGWTIDCGGTGQAGVAGETLEAYRERRLAELRAARDRDRRTVAAISGAALGQLGAGARVETPTGDAEAQVAVDGQAAGAAVADAVIADDVALPAGDVGAGEYRGRAEVEAPGPGACTMTLTAADGDDPRGVTGGFEVIRVVDTVAERRAARAEARQVAARARIDLQAALVTQGADPMAQQRARDRADAEARAALELRLRAEADARAEAQAEVDARAWSTPRPRPAPGSSSRPACRPRPRPAPGSTPRSRPAPASRPRPAPG
ncbi:MAG: hypothetical protein H6708_10755 [Kofleriaceae bacterium]|nr:hypothetical protein [Kofleriaceae bacterium]